MPLPSHENPRVPSVVALAVLLLTAGACSDSQTKTLDSSTGGARGEDASARRDASRPDDLAPDDDDDDEPDDEGDEPGSEPDEGEDAGEDEADADAPAEELDATADDASAEADASDPGDAAAPDAGLDGGQGEGDAAAQPDASAPDAGGCPAGQTADACGVCGGDGASCRHALAGRYVARTQFYSHQHGTAGDSALDLITNGSLLSTVTISATGVATEHYCYLEMVSPSPNDAFIWSPSSTVQQIPDTSVALETRSGRYVRPLAGHRAYFGWSPVRPAGCTDGEGDELPESADDCRVLDIGGDGEPGGSMFLEFTAPATPDTVGTQLELQVVALLNLEWDLGPVVEGQIVGSIEGGLQTSVLDLRGELASYIGSVDNSMCDGSFGHVELVRSELDCAALLAGHSTDPVDFGVFDAELDPDAPATVELCSGPAGS